MSRQTIHVKGAAGAPPVKSADRVLSIFEYFERVRSPRTLSEISQDLCYPVSSALALLRSVQSMGYLEFDPESKSYSPSIRFAMLGQWIYDLRFADTAIVPLIQHLAMTTRETALLSVQTGLQLQHVHIVQTEQALSYLPLVGTLRPLLRSAGGKMLLAQQSDELVVKTVERINALGADEGRIFDPREVLTEITTVRAQGFAFSANLFEQGAAIIAVALPPGSAKIPMSISIGGPASRITEDSLPHLRGQILEAIAGFLPCS